MFGNFALGHFDFGTPSQAFAKELVHPNSLAIKHGLPMYVWYIG